jgi:hypothetical protein
MSRTSGKTIALASLAGALAAVPALAAAPRFDWSAELRLRAEAIDGPARDAAKDASDDTAHGRLRLGADLVWPRLELHALVQGAASRSLPANGAFGAGPVYFAANGERDPESSDVAELSVALTGRCGKLVLGRQAWAEGNEVATGVAYLDGVKKRRLGERLVGNWDWVNVGRRFDGLTFAGGGESTHLAAFAFRPTGGGVSYQHAFETLDDFDLYGLTVTGRYGRWLPRSDVRLFALRADDGRPAARAAAGGAIAIDTLGASLLAGGSSADFVLWGAWQTGDWGRSDHEAWAAFVEGGGKLGRGPRAPTVRAGFAVASGDGEADRVHATFANLLPTNHRFYGSADHFAFQNVQELFVELIVVPGAKSSVRFAVHHFDLNQEQDAWYGGSGAFDETALGFAARRPPGGFTRPDLGWEADAEGRFTLPRGFTLDAGVTYFAAGAAGREFLTADSTGWWGYLQLVYQQ